MRFQAQRLSATSLAFSGGRLAQKGEYPPFMGVGFEFLNPKTPQSQPDLTYREYQTLSFSGKRVHPPMIHYDMVIITNDGQLPNRLGDVDAYRLLNEQIQAASILLKGGKKGTVSIPKFDPNTQTIVVEKPRGRFRRAWATLFPKPAPSPNLYEAHNTLVSYRDKLKARIVTEILNPAKPQQTKLSRPWLGRILPSWRWWRKSP